VSFLLDTNVISETRRKTPSPQVVSWFRGVEPNTLNISVLTLGEIAKGIAKHTKRDAAKAAALIRWLESIRLNYADRILGIDAEIAEAWGRLAAERSLAVIDGLIAATALVHNLTLVTRNIGDVAGTGVLVLNPWDAQ
jgi:toxin FitB